MSVSAAAVAESPKPAADPNSALFEKLAAMKPPSASASPRPGASPSGNSFLGQQQNQYNPNAPRGPFAPVPANQGLLQPLIPTSGTGQFVPTKVQSQPTGMMGMQMTGMQPQQTGWGGSQMQMQMPMQMQMQMQPQMTGMNGMGMMGMQPQQTGLNGSPFGSGSTMMGMSSPTQFGGSMQAQQTGFSGMQGMQTQQQQTGFGGGGASQQDDKDKFNASNIFQQVSRTERGWVLQGGRSADRVHINVGHCTVLQMKSGQFAKDPNAQPQGSQKYDALRPQPTGFQPGGVMQPQFTGMGFGQPQQPPQGGYGGYGGY